MNHCTEHELLAELKRADDFSEYFLDELPVKLYAKLKTDPEVDVFPIWGVMSLLFLMSPKNKRSRTMENTTQSI